MSVIQPGDVLLARAVAAELTAAGDLDAVQRERCTLVVTELATNLLRHAPAGGVLLLRRGDGPRGLECLCLDRGPGISDIAEALRDGESSGSGLGLGLGAIRRLSDEFSIHSKPGIGTAILARVGVAEASAIGGAPVGVAMIPMAGQDHCGDGWAVSPAGLIAVIDGLGHGPAASLAARRAEQSLAAARTDPLEAIVVMHAALEGTRGAVAMVVYPGADSVRFCGVGNISGALMGVDRLVRLHSSWGVVGSNLPVLGVHELAWVAGDVLLLASDGVGQSSASFTSRHLRYVHPTLAAAIILRDAPGKLDDQTVLVLRR